MNPYKKVFENQSEWVVCDFSIMVPSWKINSSYPWSKMLYQESIEFAEKKHYYSFYQIIDFKNLNEYKDFIKKTAKHYQIIVEEIVPPNEKSINILFWNWLFCSVSQNKKLCVVNHILPEKYRNEK
jgi:hypothetical protein